MITALRWWQLPEVAALESVVFEGQEAWSAETFWSELAQVDSRHYVASWESALTGYAGIAVGPDDCWIQTVAVAPTARGRGLGDALLSEVESFADGRISLEVRADNVAAQHLYARRGYEVVARRRGYYGPGADALIMERRG